MDRREFLRGGTLAVAGSVFAHGQSSQDTGPLHRITIHTKALPSSRIKLAETELLAGLRALKVAPEVIRADAAQKTRRSLHCVLAIEPARFKSREEYEISAAGQEVFFSAVGEQALLYAVFDFLEHQGIVYGIDGETLPLESPVSLKIPALQQPWTGVPRFAVRGLLPWPDFLNCVSVYNDEDFKAYFANMLRMRFNMFGLHVYTQNDSVESYLSFDFAGVGHRAYLENTTMSNWGYLPQRTSSFKMGSAQFFDRETFGADATRLAADNWEIADRTTAMLRKAFEYASTLGIRTGIGFEPYNHPPEILRALPPEAKEHPGGLVESATGKDLLERRLADLLERYPTVDYVWLWEDEAVSWESRKKQIPLSPKPFQQAHDFLRRNAPKKQLVLSGWGGVVRNFQFLHERLPGDVIFSSLSDSLGWDPVNEAFGNLEGRERWPIPWLEDDPSMWFPQFRASRFENDMRRAENYGCQGLLGVHWRHRIVDPTATYMARAAWDTKLSATAHYRNFCAAQASPAIAAAMAGLFVDCDQNREIISTFSGTSATDGYALSMARAEGNGLAGDYEDAFAYDRKQPNLSVLPTQKHIAESFRRLLDEATSPTEKERIGYFAGFLGLMVPYCDAFEAAHRLGDTLKTATKLRTAGNEAGAQATALQQGMPLWLTIVPLVRQTMLTFQNVITTRNDLGQMASMQNKFVRIALEQLRLSIKEFLGELPPEMGVAYDASISSESAVYSRIFIPTRPSFLKTGDTARIFINVPGNGYVGNVTLHLRRDGAGEWSSWPVQLAGRHVYEVNLGPFEQGVSYVEYYASATFQGKEDKYCDPPEPGKHTYRLTVLAE